jgi:hypothetical protein
MTDIERIATILSDGRWHCSDEFADMVCTDYRARISEMRRRGANLGSRPRVHVSLDGRKRIRNDWRDVDAYERVLLSIADQARALRDRMPVGADGTDRVPLLVGDRTIEVTIGRLMYLAPDALAEEVASLWCDPYRTGAR